MVVNASPPNSSADLFTCYDPSIFIRAPSTLHTNYIIAAVFNAILSVTATLGNTLILFALKKATTLNRTSNYLLCCLAVSDLMVGLVVQPLHVIYCIYGIIGGSKVRCYSRILFQWTSDYFIAVSFLTIVAISVDRYFTLCKRHAYRSTLTANKTRAVIAFVWITCLSFPLGRLVSSSISMILSSIIFIIFLLIPSFTIFKIYRFLKQHEIQISSSMKKSSAAGVKTGGFDVLQYKRSIATLICVYLTLLVCFLPSIAVTAAWITADRPGKLRLIKVGNFSLTFIMFNSTLNPPLYCWRIREVRQLIINLLNKFFCCKIDRNHRNSVSSKTSEDTRL